MSQKQLRNQWDFLSKDELQSVAVEPIKKSDTCDAGAPDDLKYNYESTHLKSKPYKMFFYHKLLQESIQESLKNPAVRRQCDKEWKEMDPTSRMMAFREAEDFFETL